jgi:hypothetical protein
MFHPTLYPKRFMPIYCLGRARTVGTAWIMIATGHVVCSSHANMVTDHLVHTVNLICAIWSVREAAETTTYPPTHEHARDQGLDKLSYRLRPSVGCQMMILYKSGACSV